MTEQQARNKWCPMARVHSQAGAYNRSASMGCETAGTKCVASECMAWRWENKGEVFGYCGLAGGPLP